MHLGCGTKKGCGTRPLDAASLRRGHAVAEPLRLAHLLPGPGVPEPGRDAAGLLPGVGLPQPERDAADFRPERPHVTESARACSYNSSKCYSSSTFTMFTV